MDYQSIIVYTVIAISPKRYEALDSSAAMEDGSTKTGCFSCFKNVIKRTLTSYTRSSVENQQNAISHGNRACVYYDQGLVNEAIQFYKKAIELKPNFPDAYCNLANVLKEQGKVEEAISCLTTALKLCPNHADSLNNLANVKREMGQVEEAIKLYTSALQIHPNFAVAHSNLASILQQQGKMIEAITHYKQAVRIQPSFADAYSNMGNALKEMHNIPGAMRCYKEALSLNSKFADAHSNLGSLLKDTGNVEDAIVAYMAALECKPDFPDAFCNLTHCMQVCCDWVDYEERIKNVIEITIEQMENNRLPSVHPHHAMLYPLSFECSKYIAQKHANLSLERVILLHKPVYLHKKLKSSDDRLRIGYVSSDFGNHPTSHLMQSIPGLHNREKFEIFCYALTPSDGTEFRIKIANESDHFIDLSKICTDEATDMIFKHGIHILINMNGYTKGSRNEIFALQPAPIQVMWLGYPATSGARYMDYVITDAVTCPNSKIFTEKLAYLPNSYFVGDHKRMFPHLYHRIILTDQEWNDSVYMNKSVIANTVNVSTILKYWKVTEQKDVFHITDGIGIDFSVYSKELVVRLQSLQLIRDMISAQHVTVITDDLTLHNGALLTAVDQKAACGETVPNGIIITSRQQYGLPEKAIVYCNFNQLYKIDPVTFEIWIKIVKAVPNSVLWLLRFPQAGEENLRKTAEQLGLPRFRLIFTNVAQKEEHVRRAQLVDICLDTYVCNGHTTSMDILWTGTPVVTLPGETLASRVAASQLMALGCPELIAKTRQHYQEIAVKLGKDKRYLAAIRAHILHGRNFGSLFNCNIYAKNLENLYDKMWNNYIANDRPSHLTGWE